MTLCEVVSNILKHQVEQKLAELAPEHARSVRTVCEVKYEFGSWIIEIYRENKVTRQMFLVASWSLIPEDELIIPMEVVTRLRRATVWGRLI